jgi:hypothetical protein
MNTHTYVGIFIALILVVLFILYLTGVFSSGQYCKGYCLNDQGDNNIGTSIADVVNPKNIQVCIDACDNDSTCKGFDWQVDDKGNIINCAFRNYKCTKYDGSNVVSSFPNVWFTQPLDMINWRNSNKTC